MLAGKPLAPLDELLDGLPRVGLAEQVDAVALAHPPAWSGPYCTMVLADLGAAGPPCAGYDQIWKGRLAG